MTEADRRIITEGNASVHGGDAVFDVTLYSSTGRRDDDAVYERLYGMGPLRVLAINEFFAILRIARPTCTDYKSTIAVLNTHSGVAASQYQMAARGFTCCLESLSGSSRSHIMTTVI
ncbi:hypothetical protein DFP73DRAFT_564487 [Morchella snyderi]|nr:hypothetical protein DFP73DRAFT_564487 [Morchella snyderi]